MSALMGSTGSGVGMNITEFTEVFPLLRHHEIHVLHSEGESLLFKDLLCDRKERGKDRHDPGGWDFGKVLVEDGHSDPGAVFSIVCGHHGSLEAFNLQVRRDNGIIRCVLHKCYMIRPL